MAKEDVADQQNEETMQADMDGDGPLTQEQIKEQLKGIIGVKVEDAGTLRKSLTISVPREHLTKEFDREYGDLVTEAVVPGFRKGRAPRRLVEKRYGREVGEQVQTRMLSNAYLAAVEKEDLKVLGDPEVWAKPAGKDTGEELMEMTTALSNIDLPDEGDFSFRCEVEIKPEFELPKLEGVQIEKPEISIEDKDVDEQIDRIRARRGTWAPVTDENAKVETDDLLICDIVLTADGKEYAKKENEQLAARPQFIEGVAVGDFGKKVEGTKVGDSVKIDVEMPDDHVTEDLRGKKAELSVTVNDLKRLKLPPMDKDFLEAQGFESEKEFKDFVRERMESELDWEIRKGMRNQVRKYLLDETKIDLPEGLSSRQAARVASRRIVEMQRQGVPIAEIEKHADELRTSAKEQAGAELKLYFILEAIAEEFDVDISEEELNSQIAQMAAMYGKRFDRMRDELSKDNGLMQMYLDLRDEKCIDKIIGDGNIVEPSGDDGESGGQKKAKKKKKAAAKSEKDDDDKPAAKKKTTKKTTKKASKKKSS